MNRNSIKTLVLIVSVSSLVGLALAAERKVTMCHNGKTIQVSESAVETHLAHGDHLGPCSVTSSKNK